MKQKHHTPTPRRVHPGAHLGARTEEHVLRSVRLFLGTHMPKRCMPWRAHISPACVHLHGTHIPSACPGACISQVSSVDNENINSAV